LIYDAGISVCGPVEKAQGQIGRDDHADHGDQADDALTC
jgi:hypothetical protein